MAFTVRATAIVPKGFKVENVRREVAKALIDEGKRDRGEFNKTVQAWTRAPSMHYETKITDKEASVWIGPKGALAERWSWIDEGTGPRSWTSAKQMVFPFQGRGKSYNPKTRSLWLGSVSGAGQKFGDITRTHTIKNHSIEPRYWSRTLAAQRIGPFARNVQDAINRGMA